MSSNMRFSAYFDFIFNAVQTGEGPNQIFQTYIDNSRNVTIQLNQAAQQASNTGGSLRRLALDFRLVSSSIRTVVRELGLQDTVVGQVAGGLQGATAAVTGLISVTNIYARFTTDAAGATIGFGAGLKAMWASALPAIGVIATFVVGLVALLAVLYVINRVFERATGIEQYREQIDGLGDSIEVLEDRMKDLRLEQLALNESSSELSAAQADLNLAYEMGALTTQQYEEQTAALATQKTIESANSANLRLEQSRTNRELQDATAQQEALEEAIKETQAAAIRDLFNIGGERGMGGPQGMQGNQVGSQVQGRGDVNLTVSLEGANIYGEEGVFQAVNNAGRRLQEEYELEASRGPRTSTVVR